MKKYDAYLYGMILMTNSFLLKGPYPEPDTYGEIKKRYILPGGETGTAATVLSNLGCRVIMDGPYMGNKTYPQIIDFYKGKTVDTSRLYLDTSYDGLEDFVIIDQKTRTPFGTFEDYYTNGLKRWHEPLPEDILNSKVAAIDPWFEDKSIMISEICKENGIPYVTIDCHYDSIVHKNCSVDILSNEFISVNYPECDRDELIKQYIANTDGLVIFTLGAKDIQYGRKGQDIKHLKPYSIEVVSTLGAGDSFKAACTYALLNNLKDDELVKFAAATAACACTVFPLPLNPPSLDQIHTMMSDK